MITADITGKYLASHEPSKLAAIELNYKDQSHAPYIFGGLPAKDNTVTGPRIEIKNGLSILACGKADCVVKGIESTPEKERPPLYVHILFTIKMLLVGLLSLIIGGYFASYIFKREWIKKRATLFILSISGIIAVSIVELGWMLTEIGRQPWAVRGFVTTEEAFTKSQSVTTFGYAFPLAYVGLFTVTILALKKLIAMERSRKGGTLS